MSWIRFTSPLYFYRMYLKKITWEDKRELPSLTIHVLAALSPLQASRISLLFLVPAMYVITLQCNELTTGARESLKLKVTVLVFDMADKLPKSDVFVASGFSLANELPKLDTFVVNVTCDWPINVWWPRMSLLHCNSANTD